MIAPGQSVCVAVSGGPDSTALLFVLRELSERLGCNVKACHFDHALRPESADDAQFAKTTAEKLGVEFVMERDQSPATRSIQDQARRKRYGFFEKLLDSGYADLMATGHTLDDTVETSIMWMLRGAGPSAFGGTPPVRDRYIRPLLDIRKSSVLNWLDQRKIGSRHDASNDTDSYLRNRIRRHVIPAMERQAPGAVEAVARLARLTRGQSLLLESFAKKRLSAITRKHYENRVVVDPSPLNAEPEAMRLAIYRAALQSTGADLSRLSLKHFDAIERLTASSTLGRSVDLPGGLYARIDHAGLTLGQKPELLTFKETAMTCPLELPVGDGVLTVRKVDDQNRKSHLVDADKIPPAAVFRTRNPGDFMKLPRLAGRKKLKTFLIDRKTPSGIRGRMPLLAIGSEILWVPRLFIAPSVSAEKDTKNCIELSWD